MASRKRRKRRPARRAWLPDLDLPILEQRHWDLIGLGMVAFAAFFACVFYLGWAGGKVGGALADGLLAGFGAVGYLAPVSSPSTRASSASRAVSIRIGTSPSARMRRATSMPSSFGSPRSSTTASGSNTPDS